MLSDLKTGLNPRDKGCDRAIASAPPETAHSVSPFVSVMVTIVLLNVDCTWAMPRLTLRRAFFFLLLAILVVVSGQWIVNS